jgi:hypothetical protein
MIHKSAQKLDPREQHYWIESSHQGMQLFLRYLPPLTRQADRVRPILYIHGATFPSALRSRTGSTVIRGGMLCARPASMYGASISTAMDIRTDVRR